MKKQKRFTLRKFWETQKTKELLETYDGLMTTISLCEDSNQHKKKFEKEARSLERFLKEHLMKLPDYEIEALYNQTDDYEGSSLVLLNAYAKKCQNEKLVWTYNENQTKNEEVDKIVKKRLKKHVKTIVEWYDIVDKAQKGSRISYYGIEQMIPLVKCLSDLLFTLQLNKESLTNTKKREENHALLMAKVETVRIWKYEEKELKDQFEWEKTPTGRKLKLRYWK